MLALSLPGRSFVGIDLEGAELFAIDLSRANLRDAQLVDTQMRGANLYRAQLRGALLSKTQMQGAELRWADMQGAALTSVQMQGASLDGTDMRASSIFNTQMQGAYVSGADMQGAQLGSSNLTGAIGEMGMRGATGSCDGLRTSRVTVGQITHSELTSVLQLAGVPQETIEGRYPWKRDLWFAACPDAPEQPLSQRPQPSWTETGAKWRYVACQDALVAEHLWLRKYDATPAYAILASPPEATCKGLRDVPYEIRRSMDAFWDGLSSDEKAAAERSARAILVGKHHET